PEQSRGKAIHEVARIPSLLGFVEKALHNSDTTEMEIDLPGPDERYLQVHSAALKDSVGEGVGIVLVFNDITRLKELESVRRDFVANVSHELRTPITAITGSVETLLEGAQNNPEDNKRFLEMIARHSDRLNSLVDDLLLLARFESEVESDDVELRRSRLSDVLQVSIQACQETARQRQVVVTCSCDPGLEANVNQSQFEHAVSNLIDNAIKYSEKGSSVTVKAIATVQEIMVSVQDHGVGIAAEHLPRLFERFYRVEKSRSREAGGTGLGLAIVKHVVVAHGGRVSVDSTPGEGSTFNIYLPVRQ
ncbi:MAG: GHKL domain-containing protein, partial [candidate division Zixibacteria bacterium]|nr:GHKL domain-containing protein [candidate division Zixibacteria bacterium]